MQKSSNKWWQSFINFWSSNESSFLQQWGRLPCCQLKTTLSSRISTDL